MRIFPEMWASTLCPPSTCRRNMAFGRASKTVPSISIFSSLTIAHRQNFRAVFSDGHRVLEMRRWPPVFGDHRPTVGQNPHPPGAGRKHGLQGQDKPDLKPQARARLAEIRNG